MYHSAMDYDPRLAWTVRIFMSLTLFALGGTTCLALLAWGLWLGPNRQRRQ